MHGIALSTIFYYYFQSWLVLELSIAGKDALRRGCQVNDDGGIISLSSTKKI